MIGDPIEPRVSTLEIIITVVMIAAGGYWFYLLFWPQS